MSWSKYLSAYNKWFFTWFVALIPVIFHAIREYWLTGGTDIKKLCASGGTFVVSIVMVSEPLMTMITEGIGPSVRNRIVVSGSIILLIFNACFFALFDSGGNQMILQPNGNHIPNAQIACDSVASSNGNDVAHDSCQNLNSQPGHINENTTARKNNNTTRKESNDNTDQNPNFRNRVFHISLVCFICSLVLGGIAVFQTTYYNESNIEP